MPKISRRTFLKMTAATGMGVAAANTGFFVHPDCEALAASDAPEEVKYSHCVMCNHTPKCGIKAIVKEGKIYRVERRDGYNNNLLCAKGVASLQEMYDPNRLLYPMKRTNPKGSEDPGWERITWEEALATIAEKFNGIKEKYGAEKVLFMTGDPKEPRPALQRLAYTFGSPNMGTESSTCYYGTELTAKLLYGPEWYTASSQSVGPFPTAEQTKVALLWGTNPGWSSTFVYNAAQKVKDSGTVKYIVVDPRVTPTVQRFADVHVQLRPGTDGALALCMGNYLIEHDAYDKEFVEKWVHGFEEYKEYVKEFTIEKTAEICQVPAEVVQAACEMIANAGGPIVVHSSAAFPHHTNGINNYRAIMILVSLTGSLDVPGGHVLPNEPLPFDSFGSTFEFNRVDRFLKIKEKRADKEYFPVWADMDGEGSVQINRIPEYVKNGDLKACLMLGGNAMMWPQSHEYQEAFQNMEFVVAADLHIRPWTHNYVDMLLPAAQSFERTGPLTVFGRKIFLREPIVEPAGEARGDWRICCDIGTALGYADDFWGGGEKAEEECVREILRTLDVGVTLEDLRAATPDGVTIPMKEEAKFKKYELGLLRPDGKPGFTTTTGKVEYVSEILKEHGLDDGLPVYKEPTYSPVSTPDVAKDFPLILCTGSRVPMYTHSKERDVPWLRQLMPDPIIRLHISDAEDRGLVDGDMVELSSPFGKLQAKLEVTNMIKPGMIDMFHGWAQANVNELLPRDFDPISGFPAYKEGLCQVKKI